MSDWKKTTCVLCGVNCGLEVQTAGNRITKVRPDKDSPRSQGYACRKGMSIAYFQDHAQRLTHPLKRLGPRGGNRWKRVSWDEALSEMAERFATIKKESGAEFVAMGQGTGRPYTPWNLRFGDGHFDPESGAEPLKCYLCKVYKV